MKRWLTFILLGFVVSLFSETIVWEKGDKTIITKKNPNFFVGFGLAKDEETAYKKAQEDAYFQVLNSIYAEKSIKTETKYNESFFENNSSYSIHRKMIIENDFKGLLNVKQVGVYIQKIKQNHSYFFKYFVAVQYSEQIKIDFFDAYIGRNFIYNDLTLSDQISLRYKINFLTNFLHKNPIDVTKSKNYPIFLRKNHENKNILLKEKNNVSFIVENYPENHNIIITFFYKKQPLRQFPIIIMNQLFLTDEDGKIIITSSFERNLETELFLGYFYDNLLKLGNLMLFSSKNIENYKINCDEIQEAEIKRKIENYLNSANQKVFDKPFLLKVFYEYEKPIMFAGKVKISGKIRIELYNKSQLIASYKIDNFGIGENLLQAKENFLEAKNIDNEEVILFRLKERFYEAMQKNIL